MCAMNPRLLRPLATGFSPRQIAGLSAWYDASVASSLTLTSGFVSQWDDLSGSGLHLTQATEASRPGTGAINGKTAVDFDGSNDLMQVTADVFPGTLLMAFAQDNVGATGQLAASVVDATGNQASVIWSGTQEWRLGGFDFDALSQVWSSGGTAVASQPLIATLFSQSGSTSRIDGADLPGTTSSTGSNEQGIVLGSRVISGSPSLPLNGQIGEVLLFNRVLTASEVAKCEGYLAWKWGLQAQLPYDHPYARSFPGFGSQATPTDADTLTYLAAVKAADGTGVEVGVANAVDAFVTGCKSDGIWDSIKASCILAGARTLAGALVPLRGTAPTNNNFVSGDYNRETGLKADGNKYLDANRNNNTDPQDSNHHAVYVSEADSSGSASSYIDGGGTGTGANNIGRSSTVANLYLRSRCSSAGSVASGPATGLIGTNRSLAASYVARASGTNTTITQASQTPADSAVFVFARPPSPTNTTNARIAYYSIGESLDLAQLDARVSALITAIGNAL